MWLCATLPDKWKYGICIIYLRSQSLLGCTEIIGDSVPPCWHPPSGDEDDTPLDGACFQDLSLEPFVGDAQFPVSRGPWWLLRHNWTCPQCHIRDPNCNWIRPNSHPKMSIIMTSWHGNVLRIIGPLMSYTIHRPRPSQLLLPSRARRWHCKILCHVFFTKIVLCAENPLDQHPI